MTNQASPNDNLVGDILKTDGFNQLRSGRYGYVLYNKNDTYVGRSIREYGEYGQGEADLFRQICTTADIVCEVGANIGTLTMVLARAVGPQGRVLAFEPQRIVFQTLCANMAINSLTNVECFQAAVGAESGSILIPDIDYNRAGNFGGVSVDAFSQGVPVPKVTVDGFRQLSRLKLLKVDVEGMESQVLLGAKATIERCRPIIYVENDRVQKSAELITLIQSYRYRLFWHLPRLYDPNNFYGNKNNVFGNVVSVNMLCIPSEVQTNLTGFVEITDPLEHPMKQ